MKWRYLAAESMPRISLMCSKNARNKKGRVALKFKSVTTLLKSGLKYELVAVSHPSAFVELTK